MADKGDNKQKGKDKQQEEQYSPMSCIGCHETVTPNIVTDWKLSEHSKHNTSCQDCHGSAHTNEDDVDEAAIPTPEAFDAEREKLIKVCSNCHSEKFARAEMVKGDETIREIDHLMAEAIRIVSALYEQGLLEKPDSYAYDFPDLLAFHDAPTTIEQRLFVMHLEHRAGILLPCSLCRHGQAP